MGWGNFDNGATPRRWASRCVICFFSVAALALGACQSPTAGQLTEFKRNGNELRVLLMPVDVELSELSAGGVPEPQAEWTQQALKLMTPALEAEMKARNSSLVIYKPAEPGSLDIRSEHFQIEKLHEAVGRSIMIHQFVQPLTLPTKKGKFDWSLGESVRVLREEYKADYALFVFVRDSYASAGRVAVIVIGAVLGIGVQGGVQVGFASLVDLNSGDVVWFNRLARAQGDLRSEKPAQETTKALLQNFPK